MALINLPTDYLRDTRFGQELIEEGRLEGEARSRTAARIQALPLEVLESMTEALLDFSGSADLAAWMDEHGG